jgi:hypothetical protein
MDARTPLPLDPVATLTWLAFAIGGVFGFAAQRSNFCTMGAIADILIMEDWTRLRMWALAARRRHRRHHSAADGRADRRAMLPSTLAPACPGCPTSSAAPCSASA